MNLSLKCIFLVVDMSLSIEFSLSVFIIILTMIFIFHNISIVGYFVNFNIEDSYKSILAEGIVNIFTSKLKESSWIFSDTSQSNFTIDFPDLNCKFEIIIFKFDFQNEFSIMKSPSNFLSSFFIEFNGKLYVVYVLRCDFNG